MKHAQSPSGGLPSPLRIFFLMLGLICAIGLGVTIIPRPYIPPETPESIRNIITSLVITFLTAPFLWLLVVRPLQSTAMREQTRSATIVTHAVDGIVSFECQGTIQSFNPAAEAIFGYSCSEVLGQHVRLLVEENDADSFTSSLVPGNVEASTYTPREVIGRRKDGTTFAMELAISSMQIGHDRMFVALVRDITSRKQVEQALRESEARKRAILESAIDCIITVDAKGKVVEVNPAVEKTLGFSRANLMGKRLSEMIFPENHRDRQTSGVWRNMAAGNGLVLGRPVEISARRADGTEFPAEVAVTSVRTDGPAMFTTYIRDITERKRTERRLAAQHAVTGILAEASNLSDVAHLLLEALAEALNWEVGIFWRLDRAANALTCVEFWKDPDTLLSGMEQQIRSRSLSRNMGLAGQAWARREPIWIADVSQLTAPRGQRNFLNTSTIHGAFAFPVMLGDEVFAVLEFCSRKVQPPDEELLHVTATVSGDRNPKKRQQYLKGKVGDDPSVTLDLNTSNGNIEIRKNG